MIFVYLDQADFMTGATLCVSGGRACRIAKTANYGACTRTPFTPSFAAVSAFISPVIVRCSVF